MPEDGETVRVVSNSFVQFSYLEHQSIEDYKRFDRVRAVFFETLRMFRTSLLHGFFGCHLKQCSAGPDDPQGRVTGHYTAHQRDQRA